MRKRRPPITMVDGHLVAARSLDDVWATFVIPGHSYRAESRVRQEQMAHAMFKFAREIEANFQVLVVASRWSAEDYVRQMREHMPARAHEGHYLAFLAEQQELISQVARNSWTFVSVRLAGPEMDHRAQTSRVLARSREDWKREAHEQVLERKRLHLRMLSANTLRIDRHVDRADIALQRVQMCFQDARPAEPMEMQWLIRRAFSRGVAEPTLAPTPAFTSPYEAQTTVANWLSEYLVTREHGYLRSTFPGGECFQAGVCAGTLDDAAEYSRASELMFAALEEHDFPVDACLNVRWVPNDVARAQAQRRYKQIGHELLDEMAGPLGALHPGKERADLARDYHGDLSRLGDPQLKATLSYMIAGETRKQLESRVGKFRHLFPHACHRPLVDQLAVFLSHWPAQPAHVRDYERLYTPTQVGCMVPHASHDAGSQKPWAFYYAKTLQGAQPVRFDLREASDTNGAPMTVIVASLGGGKTMLGQLLFYHAFLRGAWVVDIDPKGDHRWWMLPDVRPHARVIEIGDDDRHRGMLDPLRVALAAERQAAASTFLCEVIGTEDEMIQAGIHGAVGRAIDVLGDRACCIEVVRILRESEQPEFRRAGLELEQYMSAGIVRLGFARVSDPLVDRSSSQVTVIRSRVLQTLGAGERATQSQRHSRAILRMVTYVGRKLAGEEPDVLKVVGFDEAGIMTKDALGREWIDQCALWSRSDLLAPILMTQEPDSVRGQRNRIGQWFVGRMKAREQTMEVLNELELDAEGPLVGRILGFPEEGGQFLKKDLRGNCELLRVDPGPRLVKAFDTRPERERLAREALAV